MTATLFTIAPAEAAQKRNILFPTLPDFVWSAVIIVIAIVLVAKFVVPKFMAIMDERNAKIAQGVALAEQAKQTVADAQAKAQTQIERARRDASDIRAEAHNQASKTIADAKERAQAEADRVTATAERQIQAQRQAAEVSLRDDVGALASQLAEKIVGEQLSDQQLSARVIDRFLEQLEAVPAQKGQ